MIKKSMIEWTERTWNPTLGCTEESEGCRECYAAKLAFELAQKANTRIDYEGLTLKLANGKIVWSGIVKEMEKRLLQPFYNEFPTTYFVDSMSDQFHESISFEYINKVFAVMAVCMHHEFQILTKRPIRMLEYISGETRREEIVGAANKMGFGITGIEWPLSNVWLGTSVENQKTAEQRIPILEKVPSAIRFLSCEPLLEKIEISNLLSRNNISWVICGGESGTNHRPMQISWALSLIHQCQNVGVAVFNKQLGSYLAKEMKLKHKKGGDMNEWPEELRVRQFPKNTLTTK